VYYGPEGEIARDNIGVVYDLSVSLEGDVWVLGGKVARLPMRRHVVAGTPSWNWNAAARAAGQALHFAA
jgi:hypothetical protein